MSDFELTNGTAQQKRDSVHIVVTTLLTGSSRLCFREDGVTPAVYRNPADAEKHASWLRDTFKHRQYKVLDVVP